MKSDLRMKKTLASLALAMTSTAVALHWMDPTLQAGGAPPSLQEVLSISRDMVLDSVPLKPGVWNELQIFVDEFRADGLSLTATNVRRKCHFSVDRSGRISREALWSRQLSHPDSPNAVCIQVEGGDSGSELLSPTQHVAVQSLVTALDSAIAGNGNLPIKLYSPGDSTPRL